MKAFVFPGQGSQFIGMGKDLFEKYSLANELFIEANDILGFSITDIMFFGTDDELKQTNVTQPAIFLHSVILSKVIGNKFDANMVAGHSLGEFSALVASGALNFQDGLKLVAARAQAMQKACEMAPGGMAAILGLEDQLIEDICKSIDGIVVAANYNCPGQLVISGSNEAVKTAIDALTAAGAKRALPLPVGGAFHSPLMEPARKELEDAINNTKIKNPSCAIYQNISAKGVVDAQQIKLNLIAQLTGPVKWTQTMQQMIADGAKSVTECGPGNVLQGLFKKVDRGFETQSASILL
jgi:[acyl-carrier-protein] S-malonyltransferase